MIAEQSRWTIVPLLSWISLAMGSAIIWPSAVARLFGLQADLRLVRLIGTRDVIIGIGLLRSRRLTWWLVIHALADLVDSLYVMRCLRRKQIAPLQGTAWLIFAVGSGIAAIVEARTRVARN